MWKRTKTLGPSGRKQNFSLVHRYIQHFNEVSGNKTASIRRRSKTPGVMITQFTTTLPEGKTTPDFQSKPAPIQTEEGSLAVFRAVVTGDPKPEVSWKRTLGTISDKEKFKTKYEESTGEHILEIHSVCVADADTYKCAALNEFGKAVCSATLGVKGGSTNPADFRKLLRKSKVETTDGENDERFWEAMLSADRNDYERICSEFGVTDLHSVHKKLLEKKKERAQKLSEDGVMAYDEDAEIYSLNGNGRTNNFGPKGLMDNGNGLDQGDVRKNRGKLQAEIEESDLLLQFNSSNVDFIIKIQEIKASESEDALFECVLTHPLPKISWTGKGNTLEDGEKYKISVSDHKLIHRLLVRDCVQADTGIYSALAGSTSCSAWLVVEVESNLGPGGKKIARKTTLAVDLEKVAREQQIKNQEAMEKILAFVKAKQAGGQVKGEITFTADGKITGVTGLDGNAEAIKELLDSLSESVGSKGKTKHKKRKGDDTVSESDGLRRTTQTGAARKGHDPKKKKNHKKSGGVDLDKVTDPNAFASENEASEGEDEDATGQTKSRSHSKKSKKKLKDGLNDGANENEYLDENGDFTETSKGSRYSKHSEESEEEESESSDEYSDEDESETESTSESEEEEGGEIKSSSGSGKHRKKNKKVHWKDASDPNAEVLEDEVSEGEEDEDSTGQAKPRSHAKKSKKKLKDGGNDPNASENEASEDEDEDTTGQTKSRSHSKKSKKKLQDGLDDPNALESENEASQGEEGKDSNGKVRKRSHSKKSKKKLKKEAKGKGTRNEDEGPCDETEDGSKSTSRKRRKRKGPLIEDSVIDPGVQFICGLSDVSAIINESAELTCKLSSEDCEGVWFRDGKKISPDDNFSITKDGPIHKLVIINCQEEHSGKYRFEADGRKTVSMINVKDPPRMDPADLRTLTEPVIVKTGHHAIYKVQFVGYKPIKIQWYREGEELLEDANIKIEKSASHSRLLLSRCQRKDTGEIKIKLKNEHGFTEAVSQLIVLDKPTPPLGPAEVTEGSARCIEFKWRPPKDDGGSPVINYVLERRQVGRNTWKKLGEIPGEPSYQDTDVEHGRKYCYRIHAVTKEGTSDVMETEDMQAGTLAFPGPPAPPKVVSAFNDCINLAWTAPVNTGGSRILGYIIEKRKKGSNLWSVVNSLDEVIKEKKYAVKDVVTGIEYEFRVTAINLSGPGEFSNPSEFVFARDPKKPPGKVIGLKVTETSYTHVVLAWAKPEDKPGIQDEARGYFVEIRQADCLEWSRCTTSPIIMTSFSVKGLKSMDMYWLRVIATNDGGESLPAELPNYVLAMPLPVRPKFTNKKMKSFIVLREGNSLRITVNFEASPRPQIIWLKDNVQVAKRVTISNSDGTSQLLIPSSQRSDSGIYSILVKNLVGQETFSTEVRVTDDPKPPGPVELEENVPDTVTVMWEPSPDEKRDDRLHYIVSKLDSTKRTWATVGDRLFNNKFTVCNIMHGREYHFRVYAKNDMGTSEPSESPTWWVQKKKEKFVVSVPTRKDCDLQCAPTFIVPLKLHAAPKGYECYMSCAVKGDPAPRVTWYRNHISINTNTNYYISNTCGVCSMLILRVGPKDMGEYTISAENSLGRTECSTVLSVRE